LSTNSLAEPYPRRQSRGALKKRHRFAGQGAKLQKGEALEATGNIARRFEVPPGLDPVLLRPIPSATIGGKSVASGFEPRRSRTYIWKTAKLGKFFPSVAALQQRRRLRRHSVISR
jgi:hypothetical protein